MGMALWEPSWCLCERREWAGQASLARESDGLHLHLAGGMVVLRAAHGLYTDFQGFGEDADGYCDTIIAVAEVIKLTDPSLLYLEVSTLVSKYPDIR